MYHAKHIPSPRHPRRTKSIFPPSRIHPVPQNTNTYVLNRLPKTADTAALNRIRIKNFFSLWITFPKNFPATVLQFHNINRINAGTRQKQLIFVFSVSYVNLLKSGVKAVKNKLSAQALTPCVTTTTFRFRKRPTARVPILPAAPNHPETPKPLPLLDLAEIKHNMLYSVG